MSLQEESEKWIKGFLSQFPNSPAEVQDCFRVGMEQVKTDLVSDLVNNGQAERTKKVLMREAILRFPSFG